MCRCSEFNQFSLLWAAHLFFSSWYFRVRLLNFDNCYRHKISTTKPHYLKVIDYVMTISITISTQKLSKEKLRTWAIYNLFKINQNKSLTFHCHSHKFSSIKSFSGNSHFGLCNLRTYVTARVWMTNCYIYFAIKQDMTYQSNSISFFIILGVASHTKKNLQQL